MADELNTTGKTEADGAAENQSVPLQGVSPTPPAPQLGNTSDAPENETEYERIQRLKINADEAPHSGAIEKDISKLLGDVKLPERKAYKGSGDVTPPMMDTPLAGAVEKAPEPEAKPDESKERDPVTALHTIKDDLQDIVRRRKMSIVRASALEQDKKTNVPPKLMPSPGIIARRRRVAGVVFASLLLLVLGGAALYGVAVVSQKRIVVAQQYPSLIFAEQTETVPIDNVSPGALKSAIAQARSQDKAPLGSIVRIVPTIMETAAGAQPSAQPATTQQFLTALGTQASPSLLRALGSTFFFGIHTVDINAPVLVIPVSDYDSAFAGMLAWEPTMNQDLAPAFDVVPNLTTATSGIPVERTFSDTVILNYDVRVLKDDSGNTILYYSFPTPDILIIAESPSTFSEILGRLQAQGEL